MRTTAIVSGIAGVLLGARPAAADCTNASTCPGGPVRIMFVLDGSSDLLNDGGGPAAMGTSDWDLARDVLANDGPPGEPSIFSAVVDEPSGLVISQIAHVGLVAFGDPVRTVRVLDYGPCSRDNLEWALDPRTSCAAPGCSDPWGGAPIEWTFVDGSEVDPPNFARETLSTMPSCDGMGACTGSSRAVHAGIELATANHADYVDATQATHDDGTIYVNILLVTGPYTDASTDMQVQNALEAAVDAGITTHVIAFGAGAQDPTPELMMQLDGMAGWGSNGQLGPRIATNRDELHDAIQEIVADLPLPCCYSIDCSGVGGADGGGIGNDDGNSGGSDDTADDGADGSEWGSLDGDGSASADNGADASATASASDTDGDEAGFDDDGGCRCSSDPTPSPTGWWLVAPIVSRLRRRPRSRRSTG